MKLFSAKILLSFLVVFLLSGCVGMSQACNLIPDEEMRTLMEGDFQKELLTELLRGSEGCKYVGTSEDVPMNEEKTINFIIGTGETPEQIKSAYDNAVAVWKSGNIPNRIVKDIDGIGTEAFWAYSTVLPQFITHQDNRLIIVTLGRFEKNEAQNLEKAKKVAQLLLTTEK